VYKLTLRQFLHNFSKIQALNTTVTLIAYTRNLKTSLESIATGAWFSTSEYEHRGDRPRADAGVCRGLWRGIQRQQAPTANFERYLNRYILTAVRGHLTTDNW